MWTIALDSSNPVKYSTFTMTYRLRSDLSPSQNVILDFIVKYHKKYGFAPTFSEIAQSLKINRSTAYYQAIRIEQKGYIKRNPLRRFREIDLL